MTRRKIVDLIAQNAALLPDNNLELITPAVMRAVLLDYAESLATVTSLVGGTQAVPVPMNLTTTLAKMVTGVFNVAINGNPNWQEARLIQNDIVCKTDVGRMVVSFNVTFTGPAGVDVIFTIARNGVVLPFRAIQAADGAGNPISVEFSWIFDTLVINDFFEIFIAVVTGTQTINISNAALKSLLISQYS